MRTVQLSIVSVLLASGAARAGELDMNFGLQATHTTWDDDRAGGAALGATWFFRDWLGASFLGKEQYAQIDDRAMTYLSFNAVFRKRWERVRLAGTVGLVHQHEESQAAIDAMPLESAFGVADGIRHRMASRSGVQLAIPFRDRTKGDWYVGLDLDATVFAEQTRGPRWMTSAGVSIGFTHDFSKAAGK